MQNASRCLPLVFFYAALSPIVFALFLTTFAMGLAAAPEKNREPAPASGSIDTTTGKILSEAIEFLNTGNYATAESAIAKLKLSNLSPYEHSRTEQILASIDFSQGEYGAAREHLQSAIAAGGLNDKEISDTRYQIAQIFVAESKWKEGAAALEEWFKTAQNPNSAAYYLLAVAYYQLNDYPRALAPAKKAVELMDKPQEAWIQLVLALHLQQNQFKEAVPLLKQLIAIAPEKKTYWQQLSSVYGELKDYARALAVMQLAYDAGIANEDADVTRLADLQLFNEAPFRCGLMLEEAIDKKLVNGDSKLFEKQANCWIAARDLETAITPLERAAELSLNGNLYLRLGEVQVQRNEWPSATEALQKALRKGNLKDVGYAHLLLGVAQYNQNQLKAANQAFNKARDFAKHKKMADSYLQLIKNAPG